MNPLLRNILAVLAGVILGSFVNYFILMIGINIIPPPEGVNIMDPENLKSMIHLFGPKHFITPFLAHAGGTFVGALVAAGIAANRKMQMAIIIGCVFLLGGIANVFMLPAPLWFVFLDLAGAYIPAAYLAGRIIRNKNK